MNPVTDFDAIRHYYSSFDEWSRLDTAEGRLEFSRTLDILRGILKPGSKILDLGGGPGRYAIELARDGHKVTLADLSPALLEVARKRIDEAGVSSNIDSVDEVNATALSKYSDDSFDAVIALGPFYHLKESNERKACASEIIRVMRPGGITAISFIPRLSGLAGLISRAASSPGQVTSTNLKVAIKSGSFENALSSGFQEGYYCEPDELRELMESIGFKSVEFTTIRGLAYGFESDFESLEQDSTDLAREFLSLIQATQNDLALVATSGHAIAIGTKEAV